MSALKKRLNNNGKVAFTIFLFKFYFGSVVGFPTREGTTRTLEMKKMVISETK